MSIIRKFVNSTINILGKLRVKVNEVLSNLTEAARTNSYIETYGNKADTVNLHIKENSDNDLKKAFEFNTRKAILRMGLRNCVLAVDTTKDLYYGKNGNRNVRQIQPEKGADEAFTYVVISIVKPRPLPLMAIPYRQGDDLATLLKDLLAYSNTLKIRIDCVLFDRGFYIGDLIQYLLDKRIRYLIFVPQNDAMKNYISLTDNLAYFEHIIEWNKYKSWWKTNTQIVIIKDYYMDQKTKRRKKYYWCFATNLRYSLPLIRIYKQRWQIETDFRVHDEARIKSKSNLLIVRYFYFLASLVLMACWEMNRIENPNVTFKKYLKNIEKIFAGEIT